MVSDGSAVVVGTGVAASTAAGVSFLTGATDFSAVAAALDGVDSPRLSVVAAAAAVAGGAGGGTVAGVAAAGGAAAGDAAGGVPLVGSAIVHAAGGYALFTTAHLAGVLFRVHRARLESIYLR